MRCHRDQLPLVPQLPSPSLSEHRPCSATQWKLPSVPPRSCAVTTSRLQQINTKTLPTLDLSSVRVACLETAHQRPIQPTSCARIANTCVSSRPNQQRHSRDPRRRTAQDPPSARPNSCTTALPRLCTTQLHVARSTLPPLTSNSASASRTRRRFWLPLSRIRFCQASSFYPAGSPCGRRSGATPAHHLDPRYRL